MNTLCYSPPIVPSFNGGTPRNSPSGSRLKKFTQSLLKESKDEKFFRAKSSFSPIGESAQK